MSGFRYGDFCSVLCAQGEEREARHAVNASFAEDGMALAFIVWGDPRIPSGNIYVLNMSHVQRRVWGGYLPPPNRHQVKKCTMISFMQPE